MRFSWDLIEPVCLSRTCPPSALFAGTNRCTTSSRRFVQNAGTDRFLPWDKDQRWFDTKTEHVMADVIEHDVA
ncbi:hypothetical protein ACFXI6_48430 [Streptomyces mirabilis]|uniref:hypothetical protein n=1 Tax=Streptomyces mirabilis TaxID=68239 RepID=UPI0036A6A5E4